MDLTDITGKLLDSAELPRRKDPLTKESSTPTVALAGAVTDSAEPDNGPVLERHKGPR